MAFVIFSKYELCGTKKNIINFITQFDGRKNSLTRLQIQDKKLSETQCEIILIKHYGFSEILINIIA